MSVRVHGKGDAPVLTYALEATPLPLEVSRAGGNPSLATLRILVTNDTEKATVVKRIGFRINVGSGASDLTEETNLLVTSEPGQPWMVSAPASVGTEADYVL